MLLGKFIPVVRFSQDHVLAIHFFIYSYYFCAVKLLHKKAVASVAGVNREGVEETKKQGIRVTASLRVKTAPLRSPKTPLSAENRGD